MNRATLAVAGSRKTQSIVDDCSQPSNQHVRRLVISYTLTGQRDLEQRLARSCPVDIKPVVVGWYAFLLQYFVRPFLPCKYPGRRLGGLNFEGEPGTPGEPCYITGVNRYLDSQSRAYKLYLSKLASDVAEASNGGVIDRLERIFDEIYVDEVQDLTGYDLDLLELLLNSKVNVKLVGDIRQSVFDTNPRDPRHPKFRGLGMLDWFSGQVKAGLLELTHSTETWRSNQIIATFADSIFVSYDFPATQSRQLEVTGHDGVFAVHPEHVREYVAEFDPVCLRQSKSTQAPDGLLVTNFGQVKGLTHKRILIFPTGTIAAFLTNGTELKPKTACGLYVGVTRAVHSVAFVVDKPDRTSLSEWISASQP